MWDHYESVGLWSSDYPHHDAEDAWESLHHMNYLGRMRRYESNGLTRVC